MNPVGERLGSDNDWGASDIGSYETDDSIVVLDEDERSGDENTRDVETDQEDDQRDINEGRRGC